MKIVILGGGFGGVYTLKKLSQLLKNRKDIEIILINNSNYFLFIPLLHELATGNIYAENLVSPLRKIAKNFKLIVDEVIKIDLNKQIVFNKNFEINYDYLIIALGSKTNFYGIPGAEENSFQLKSLDSALRLRRHFIDCFEKFENFKDESYLNFAVVGGGATGVELACEMSDYFYKTFAYYYSPEITKKIKIYLIEKGGSILAQFSEVLRKIALEVLKKKKIEVLLNTGVIEVGKDYLKLDNNQAILTKTIIWTAGIKANLPEIIGEVEKDKIDRLIVNEYFQVKNYHNVFALGDNACFLQNEKPLPCLAQVAVKEAKNVAQNIYNIINNKPLEKFIYHHTGDLISLGRWYAIGQIGKFTLKGKFAWWLWRTVYLSKIPNFEDKIKTAIDWTRDLFFPRDISSF
jgi:NADH dehydrogenase